MKILTPCLLVAASVLMAGSALAQDCKPAHTFETVSSGELTVAVYEYPPFSSVAADGTVGGVDNQIVEKIAAMNCLKVVPIVVDPAATIQSVISGRSDLAVGDWNRTAAREKVLGLSWPIYLDQMGIYIKDGVSKVSDLVGKKVGTISGFLWVEELQKLLGDNLSLYPNPVALAQDLAAGRVEVGVDAYPTGVYAQSKGGYQGIQIKVAEPDERVQASTRAAQSAILYTKGNAGLGEALDDGIHQLHKSGEIEKILVGYGIDRSSADVGEPRLVN